MLFMVLPKSLLGFYPHLLSVCLGKFTVKIATFNFHLPPINGTIQGYKERMYQILNLF